jgi:2',3'-cyclic-nucleotide 2'-phosphodiesterase (5'-nucleotidase family)
VRAGGSLLPALAVATIACLPVTEGDNPNLAGQTVRVTILHTTDIHSRMLPYDLAPLKTDQDLGLASEAPPYGGAARLAALIKRERALADRTLLLDSGDYFQGGPIFNANNGEPEVRWVSLMGYDGVVMGNHEFDMGPMNFADKVKRFASYPLLAANYLWENTGDPNAHGLDTVSAPYTITNVRGVRTAIIGMASVSSMYGLMDGGNSLQAVPLEQNETARAYVELLAPTVDFVVILSHLGLTEDQDLLTGYDAYYPYESARPFIERARNPWVQLEPPPAPPGAKPNTFADGTIRVFIPGVSGIDVIMGGHLHVVLNPPQVIRDPDNRPVLISHSGAFAKYLGRLDLQLSFPPEPPAAPIDSDVYRAWERRKFWGAEVVAHDYRAFPVDAIWCDDEARAWRGDLQFEEYEALIKQRRGLPRLPKLLRALVAQGRLTEKKADEYRNTYTAAIVNGEYAEFEQFRTEFLPGFDPALAHDCVRRYYDSLPPSMAERCMAMYYPDDRSDWDCGRFLPEECASRIERCSRYEDLETTHLLQPYISELDQTFALPRIFAFAPKNIVRRNSSTGGDSPLGNMTSESMRVRRRVEAEFALTNTLGIRDNLYAGPITLESMFNVFPFENTINIMYLSGAEVQELTDYVASRSAERGCQAQAQVSGITFVMDCAQAQKNWERYPCETAADCAQYGNPEERMAAAGPEVAAAYGWRCSEEKVCTAATSFDIFIGGQPLNPDANYKVAVNDYIAKGGSGFKVLKRNTTRVETGISLRDSLIDWLRGQCTCEDILGLSPWNRGVPDAQKRAAPAGEGVDGALCARAWDGDNRIIDPVVVSWCNSARQFETAYAHWLENHSPGERLEGMPELSAGKCTCQDVFNGDTKACGHLTNDLRNFCQAPTKVPIAIGEEDGRIGRRVK